MQTSSLADRILSALELRVGRPPCPYTPTRPLLCWSCPAALQSESRLAGSLYHPHPLLPAENPAEPLAAFHGVPEEGEAKRPAGDFAREPGIKLFDCWEAPSPSSPDPEISQQEGRLSWSLSFPIFLPSSDAVGTLSLWQKQNPLQQVILPGR
uniref:Uncharacterized protein n=1 Tax=Rousettus aegyptiacus TaxID=9407 RepID=A0A7J8GB90_ROUAE|nr:hypothetical protein HJG63_011738 [Rousettus aegyptiacus]